MKEYRVVYLQSFQDDSDADKEPEKPTGLSETEFRKWESILLKDMEEKFRIIPRGPVGK